MKIRTNADISGKIQSYLVTLFDSSKEKVRDKLVIQGDTKYFERSQNKAIFGALSLGTHQCLTCLGQIGT